MLVKCPKGMYLLQNNFRDAFNLDAFSEKYLEECFDNDSYIVGDIAAGILRLKGFNNDPKSKSYYGFIEEYLKYSCVEGSPFYVLKRIYNENEYTKLEANPRLSETNTEGFTITPIEKENFDKDSLELNSSGKGEPNIILDMRKINSIPKGYLPDDLKDLKDTSYQTSNKKEEPPVEVETYVSSSNGFDPSKVQNRPRNNFNRNNNKNINNNNNNNNSNKDNNHKNFNNKKKNKNKNNNNNNRKEG